jgi:protein-S-isoprenylcysteine O-methyltransferase Ste14
MFDGLALMMIMMWPFIPMFLIQIHYATGFWRKLGTWTYAATFIEWLPIAVVLYLLQEPLLQHEISTSTPTIVLGAVLVSAGIALHAWTAKLLGIKATISYTELKPQENTENKSLITSGPFGVVRHPSYWAHTTIITGVFLITGAVTVGIIAIIDLAITYFVTTELEERELSARFGTRYEEYKKQVPKFFPKLGRNRTTRN